ncbi:MAG TPA: ATP-binding protein [Polyangiaceae bacterium]|jgi:PAS domain S-box-containing protein|nr:ATP-binding protein [Polyangiaceae bacterium]
MALTNVRVPEHLGPLFERAQDFVGRYFAEQRSVPEHGTIEVRGERYVLVRAASLSSEFHQLFQSFYGADAEAAGVVHSLLFDVAHAMGLADAEAFARRMELGDPIARMSAGPLHFAHAGWAFVDIAPESRPTPDSNFYLLFDHPYSFESDSWLAAKKASARPVCTMSAGYSSGWCESSFGLRLVAVELLCRAKGDHACRFVMAPPERIEEHVARYAAEHPDLASRIVPYEVPGFFSHRTDRQLLRRNQELEQHAHERARELASINERLERDIAVHEQTLLALSSSIELNERLIEALPGGVVYVTSAGGMVRANADACRILGLSWDELSQRYVNDFEGVTVYEDGTEARPEDYPVSRALATGQTQPAATMGIRKPDGETSWAVFRAVPTRDPATSAVNGAVVTFFDITERKRFEDKLRHAQKLESLGVLAGGIAHDFNNLLVSILGNASHGKSLPPDEAADELQEVFADIETGARRAAELTKQMLDYAGQSKVRVESVDLAAVVREMMKLLKALIPKRVQLRYHFQDGLPAIQGDPTQVRQVVMNLITNAAEAMDGRQTSLVISLEQRYVGADVLERFLCDGATAGAFVSLEVEDTGVGMSKETAARVFDPFFTTKFKGRGLGMAAVLGIVRSHGGAIAIDSREGQGTKVTVLWPIRDGSTNPRAGERTRGSVLLVDDDEGVRSLVRRALVGRGYDVLVASDAVTGLRLFEQNARTVSLVMMDVTMPGMNGFDAVKVIRSSGSRVPVLLSSGYEVDTMQAASLGVSGVLEKPYDVPSLLEAVEAAIARGEIATERTGG